ncbi:hypothetical protein PUR49_18885 [Streptomyces sp. BE147]|uniref:hypothetical protein n=1 Tax=Streptomyces sp. BE147 TaxID=3002524 RepID=UPI002E76AC34|nr:hypothetical protein [Streptomyces sp. BE147]MEE1738564.1 hypothetical protein [Streptomyces sp. BE147]
MKTAAVQFPGYRSPECRVATDRSWPEEHQWCPGNRAIVVGGAVTERLHCACVCHGAQKGTR